MRLGVAMAALCLMAACQRGSDSTLACASDGTCLPGYRCNASKVCEVEQGQDAGQGGADAGVSGPDAALPGSDAGSRVCVFGADDFDDGCAFGQ